MFGKCHNCTSAGGRLAQAHMLTENQRALGEMNTLMQCLMLFRSPCGLLQPWCLHRSVYSVIKQTEILLMCGYPCGGTHVHLLWHWQEHVRNTARHVPVYALQAVQRSIAQQRLGQGLAPAQLCFAAPMCITGSTRSGPAWVVPQQLLHGKLAVIGSSCLPRPCCAQYRHIC